MQPHLHVKLTINGDEFSFDRSMSPTMSTKPVEMTLWAAYELGRISGQLLRMYPDGPDQPHPPDVPSAA